jgi:hypothetical protein
VKVLCLQYTAGGIHKLLQSRNSIQLKWTLAPTSNLIASYKHRFEEEKIKKRNLAVRDPAREKNAVPNAYPMLFFRQMKRN